MDGTVTATVNGNTVTISRQGDGNTVSAGSEISFTVDKITNQKFAGASGNFPAFKTTEQDGTAIDVAAGGTLPSSVTFTPSYFGGNAPVVTGHSLVAGAVGAWELQFETGNPLPADGKIIIEFPAEFHTVAANAATAVDNSIDGSLTASTSTRTVTIVRSGGGASEIAAGATVKISIPSITNQKFEGDSAAWVAVKTTLADGSIIDDASVSGGTLPSSVTFVPSLFNGNAPVVSPFSRVAGDRTDLNISFTTQNPIPADGKIIFEVPASFCDCQASSVLGLSGIDGNFAVSQTGTSTAYSSTLKQSGGPWVVTLARNGDGSIVSAGATVSFTVSEVINQQHIGPSGIYPLFKTTLSDGTTAIDESSPESDSTGTEPLSVDFVAGSFLELSARPDFLVSGLNSTFHFR